MKTNQDYGQLMIFMAIAVGLPRWAGAMMSADGIEIVGWLADVFKIANGLSGLGMAVLEVLSIGYIFAGVRSQSAFVNRRPNVKFWGSVFFGILILALIPVILTPFMLSQLRNSELVGVLTEFNVEWQWILSVVVAPLLIIGGVAFAREGLMEIEVPEDKRERGLRLRRENAQRKRDAVKVEKGEKPKETQKEVW